MQGGHWEPQSAKHESSSPASQTPSPHLVVSQGSSHAVTLPSQSTKPRSPTLQSRSTAVHSESPSQVIWYPSHSAVAVQVDWEPMSPTTGAGEARTSASPARQAVARPLDGSGLESEGGVEEPASATATPGTSVTMSNEQTTTVLTLILVTSGSSLQR